MVLPLGALLQEQQSLISLDVLLPPLYPLLQSELFVAAITQLVFKPTYKLIWTRSSPTQLPWLLQQE